MIYFDNAATTYPKPRKVYDAVSFAMQNYAFNAGRGTYKEAKKTFDMIEETRGKLSKLVGTVKENVVFSSSATESINNIVYGLDLKENDVVYISPFEHNAIVRTLKNIKVKVRVIPFNKKDWSINIEELSDMFIINRPKLVFLSHISNVTGFELPYTKIFELSKKHNCINVLDSAQGFGLVPINTENIDFLVFAGHKSLYASFGVAGYVRFSNIKLKNVKVGGTGSDSLNSNMPVESPYAYEAGSPNSVAIYSLNQSLEYLKSIDAVQIEKELARYFIDKLSNLHNVIIYLPENYISYGIVSFNVYGYISEEVGLILSEEKNICVRTGYHCAPLVHDFIESKKFQGTVRVSFGIFNTKDEIDVLIDTLKEM